MFRPYEMKRRRVGHRQGFKIGRGKNLQSNGNADRSANLYRHRGHGRNDLGPHLAAQVRHVMHVLEQDRITSGLGERLGFVHRPFGDRTRRKLARRGSREGSDVDHANNSCGGNHDDARVSDPA